jgi:hypothetical protein
MPKTYTVTMQITVGDELAEKGIDLIEHRLDGALEFNTDEPDYDIAVDSLTVTEPTEPLTVSEIATIAELVGEQVKAFRRGEISVGTPDDDVTEIGDLNNILTKLATY